MNRRDFIQVSMIGSALLSVANRGQAYPIQTLRDACKSKGFEAGIMLHNGKIYDENFMLNISKHFGLAANLLNEIEWGSNEGVYDEPKFDKLERFLTGCKKYDLYPRVRQIYSHENMPRDIVKNWTDGSQRTAKELEAVLIKRVDQVCSKIDPNLPVTLQVIDEILDNKDYIRLDPITKILGERVIEILFNRAREKLPNAKLTYQEEGIEVDPTFFNHKIENFIKLLEKMRKRNIPCTGVAIGGWFNPSAGHPKLSDWMFRKIRDLGYDLHVSELTTIYNIIGAPNPWHPQPGEQQEKLVSKVYREVFDYLIDLGNLKEITFWAPIDSTYNMMKLGWGGAIKPYKDAEPGILKEDFSEKKVYRQLVDLIISKKLKN